MSKADMTEIHLHQLWEEADEALSHATAVSVVGYRCPPSDEMAKAWLLDALARNASKPPVEVVLGPAEAAATRLVSLVGQTGVAVRDLRMWAEDYLSANGIGQGWVPQHDAPNDEA
jgi:hypothetical protein